MVNRTDIEAFVLGDELPPEVVAEIERALDDPRSEVRQVAQEYARLSRLAFDPDGPLLGNPRRHAEGTDSDGDKGRSVIGDTRTFASERLPSIRGEDE